MLKKKMNMVVIFERIYTSCFFVYCIGKRITVNCLFNLLRDFSDVVS